MSIQDTLYRTYSLPDRFREHNIIINENSTIEDSIIENNRLCSICIQPILSNMNCVLNCGHTFHKECIDQLINSNNFKCPLCRTQIKSYEDNNVKTLIIHSNQRINNIVNQRNNVCYQIIFGITIFILYLFQLFTNGNLRYNLNVCLKLCDNNTLIYNG